jgi:Fe-S cluster assembly ATPase SufC
MTPTAAENMDAQLKKVYVLVMGLNGAGKSTLIYKLTGDTSIVIGEGLESCTFYSWHFTSNKANKL